VDSEKPALEDENEMLSKVIALQALRLK